MTPQRSYDKYWAKSDRHGGRAWRPFVEHVAPVTLVAEALLKCCPYWVAALEQITGWSHTEIRAAVQYAAAGHDIGKLDAGFISQAPDLFSKTYPDHDLGSVLRHYESNTRADKNRSYYHGTHGPRRLRSYLKHAPQRFQKRALLFEAGAGHHGFYGRPDDDPPPPCMKQDQAAMLEFFGEIETLWGEGLPSLRMDPTRLYSALEVIAGIVVIADWLGSNKNAFPLRETWTPRSFTDALKDGGLRQAATRIAANSGLFLKVDPKPLYQVDLDKAFGCEGFCPSEFQEFVGSLTDAPLVLVEGPTGEGKTEAALMRSLGLLVGGRAHRLGFALPTRATANAMTPRLDRFLQEVCRAHTRTHLAHSTAALERRLARQENHSADGIPRFLEPTLTSMLAPAWCATIDQVFLSALRGSKHHMVRSLAAATTSVIYDEVHGSTVYMSNIMDRVLTFQGTAAVPVTLLSATLSPSLRKGLVAAYRKGMGHEDAVDVKSQGYPLVTWIDSNGGVHQRGFKPRRPPRNTQIRLIRHGWEKGPGGTWKASQADEDTVIRSLIKTYRDRACGGWVRNTVADIQCLVPRVRKWCPEIADDLFVVHASLNRYDLRHRQRELLKRLGPHDRARRPTLVLGTQIIEESFDIDLDRWLRDHGVADALVQGRGRHHRHAYRVRPPGYETPLFEVFVPNRILHPKAPLESQFGLLDLIYEGSRVPLLRTYRWLLENEGRWFADPEDVPKLMQQIFDPDLSPAELNNPYLIAADGADRSHKTKKGAQGNLAVIKPFSRVRPFMPDDGDPEVRPWTRDGFFATEILVVVEEDLQLRIPHRKEVIDLRPFAHLKGAPQAALQEALRQHGSLWTEVLKVVQGGSAHRSRIRQGDETRVLSPQGEGVALLRALWEASGDHPRDLLVVSVPHDSASARVSRKRESREWGVDMRTYSVGYDRDVGLLVEA